ncbi:MULTISPECIES: signal peptidase I [Aneurinibacillus]|uniref:Signal peptidase I n=1 Tax=Aneurinibacillus danicus TaxID=267746 RepID=A0A511V690_9BACL|nr:MULTISPECIES: signal peptidase I [Aneurinibacillus]GEN33428.1 signal peptidase I S [Aneurinibacillus danicus]
MKKQAGMVRWSRYFLVLVTGLVVVRIFFFAPYVVEGISMYPTLENHDRIVVNKWIYYMRNPQYGDVVVLHANDKEDYIKRIIGMEGDELELKEGVLYRNGKVVDEPYINEATLGEFDKIKVPRASYFVMGDNRNRSMDSREIGFISRSSVVGRAEFIFYPFQDMQRIE